MELIILLAALALIIALAVPYGADSRHLTDQPANDYPYIDRPRAI
jgi:hypothetical protein